MTPTEQIAKHVRDYKGKYNTTPEVSVRQELYDDLFRESDTLVGGELTIEGAVIRPTNVDNDRKYILVHDGTTSGPAEQHDLT